MIFVCMLYRRLMLLLTFKKAFYQTAQPGTCDSNFAANTEDNSESPSAIHCLVHVVCVLLPLHKRDTEACFKESAPFFLFLFFVLILLYCCSAQDHCTVKTDTQEIHKCLLGEEDLSVRRTSKYAGMFACTHSMCVSGLMQV